MVPSCSLAPSLRVHIHGALGGLCPSSGVHPLPLSSFLSCSSSLVRLETLFCIAELCKHKSATENLVSAQKLLEGEELELAKVPLCHAGLLAPHTSPLP